MNLEYLRRNYKPQIFAMATRYGVSNIRVFGSVAEGNETETSDVDFLVTAAPGTSLIMLAGLQNNLEDMLHCKVDIVTDGERLGDNSEFKTHIIDKAKNL